MKKSGRVVVTGLALAAVLGVGSVATNTGKEEKQLVAGIRTSYKEEELVGRQIIVVNNLEPAVIRGQESNGMLLAVSDDQGIALLQADREVQLGSLAK